MNRVIFLDRDGVINEYPGDYKYVCSVNELKILPNVKKAIESLYKAGYKLFVISNQAGVSKGIYSQKALDEITKKVLGKINNKKKLIEKILYCIHAEEQNCNCRKPKIGLINQALEGLSDVDLANSYFIGDTVRDVKTGKGIGCKTILVLSGKEKIGNKQTWEVQPDFITEDLYQAAKIILRQNKA